MIFFTLPLKTESEMNKRGHWTGRASRMKNARRAVAQVFPRRLLVPVLHVLLERVSAGELDDDNLRSALKGVRDGVAHMLRIDDASPLVRWEYAQIRGSRGHHEVRVTISQGAGQLGPPVIALSPAAPEGAQFPKTYEVEWVPADEPLPKRLRRLAKPATYPGGGR